MKNLNNEIFKLHILHIKTEKKNLKTQGHWVKAKDSYYK